MKPRSAKISSLPFDLPCQPSITLGTWSLRGIQAALASFCISLWFIVGSWGTLAAVSIAVRRSLFRIFFEVSVGCVWFCCRACRSLLLTYYQGPFSIGQSSGNTRVCCVSPGLRSLLCFPRHPSTCSIRVSCIWARAPPKTLFNPLTRNPSGLRIGGYARMNGQLETCSQMSPRKYLLAPNQHNLPFVIPYGHTSSSLPRVRTVASWSGLGKGWSLLPAWHCFFVLSSQPPCPGCVDLGEISWFVQKFPYWWLLFEAALTLMPESQKS